VAEKYVALIRQEFHDATHNCFAYRIDVNQYRYSDDGEPSGTAGKPLLSAIDRYHLYEVVLLVTRYFGGTKLGTGGLIRAYSECAESVLSKAKIIKQFNFIKLSIRYPYDLSRKIQQILYKYDIKVRQRAVKEGMEGKIEVLPSRLAAFKSDLLAAGGGRLQIKDS
jgi:uncharacterized YigZ family protein